MEKLILAALVAAMPMAAKAANGNPCTDTNAVVAAQTANMQSIVAIRKGVSLGAITQQELLRDLDQLIAQDEQYLARMRELGFPSATKCDINALPEREEAK
jgi:3-deoxy-D-manno-octulosonic-acid transferase